MITRMTTSTTRSSTARTTATNASTAPAAAPVWYAVVVMRVHGGGHDKGAGGGQLAGGEARSRARFDAYRIREDRTCGVEETAMGVVEVGCRYNGVTIGRGSVG